MAFYKRKPYNPAMGKEADARNLRFEEEGNSRNDPPGFHHYGAPDWERPGPHTGKGPKGYKRSDERIQDDICSLLTQNGEIDASDIEVTAEGGVVTLWGTVPSRREKRLAGYLLDTVFGVADVNNELTVRRGVYSGALDAETRSREKGPGVSQDGLGIQPGMLVVGNDGAHVGHVKQVEQNDIVVSRALQHDLYVPYSAFYAIQNGRVILSLPASDVDRWGWDKPVVIPPAP